jgi:hypothetical protein
MATRQQIDVRAVLILAVLFIAVWVGWDTPLVYPIKIFVVFLHELGHALAALLTGGQVVSIQIFPDESGLTTTRSMSSSSLPPQCCIRPGARCWR